MTQLSIYLFGPPRLEIDGESTHISRRKAMALLAYLAVTAQPHSRESLAALLWLADDHSKACGFLRQPLSPLHQTLSSAKFLGLWQNVRWLPLLKTKTDSSRENVDIKMG